MSSREKKSPRTTFKLIVLVSLAATALTALAWVNQQNVRDVGPGSPPVNQPANQSGF